MSDHPTCPCEHFYNQHGPGLFIPQNRGCWHCACDAPPAQEDAR